MIDIIFLVVVLTTIILIHELGHFIFARRAKILCHEFSIGMGPALYQKKKGEVVYSVRAIPLGGYVSMAGEEMSKMIYVDQHIGVNLNSFGMIKEIVLNNETKHDLIGQVKEFDLYGENMSELYIVLNIDGNLVRYEVSREAKYILSSKKDLQISPHERTFESKTLWQRFLVVFAGPASNFILAFLLLFFLAFYIGKPSKSTVVGKLDPGLEATNIISSGDQVSKVNNIDVNNWDELDYQIRFNNNNDTVNLTVNNESKNLDLLVVFQGLGFTNEYSNRELVVGRIFGNEKDLLVGDKILGIKFAGKLGLSNINYVRFEKWNEVIEYVNSNGENHTIYMLIERNGVEKEISYEGYSKKTIETMNANYIEYVTGLNRSRNFDIFYPFYYPFKQIGASVSEMFATLQLLFGKNNNIGIGDLSGPVGIFSLVKSARSNGIASFIQFVAFLSVNIGLLNLLPVPALDGGRLIFIGYEAITRKKVPKKIENFLIGITFILLFALMIFVTFSDIGRLI